MRGGHCPPLKAAITAARPTDACKAKQEIGKIKGVPQQGLGNERKNDFFVILREPGRPKNL